MLPEPTYAPFILARNAERVKATMDRLNLKLTSLRDERVAIAAKMIANPANHSLKKELREIDDDISKIEIELKDEVKMKLTDDEKTAHGNAWGTHRELTDRLKTSRGKLYSLLLGQCTQLLVGKMKQDND